MPSLGITETPRRTVRTFVVPPFEERFEWWIKKISMKEAAQITRVGYLICQMPRKYAGHFGLQDSFVVLLPDGAVLSLKTGKQL